MSNILEIVSAIATLAASLAAVCALGTWRGQMIGERRAGVAEQALTDAYAFRNFFNEARDKQSAHNSPPDRDDDALFDDARQAPRLNAYSVAHRALRAGNPELKGRLQTDEHRMRAAFAGEEAAAPIAAIWTVWSEAVGILHTLTILAQQGQEPGELEQQFWATDSDALTKRMDRAILALEGICQPAISARDAASRSACDRLFSWLTGRQ